MTWGLAGWPAYPTVGLTIHSEPIFLNRVARHFGRPPISCSCHSLRSSSQDPCAPPQPGPPCHGDHLSGHPKLLDLDILLLTITTAKYVCWTDRVDNNMYEKTAGYPMDRPTGPFSCNCKNQRISLGLVGPESIYAFKHVFFGQQTRNT